MPLLGSSLILLMVGASFALAPAAADPACVSLTGCDAEWVAVCVEGPCATDGFVAASLLGTATNRGSGMAFGFEGASTQGGNAFSVNGPASGWTAVSVNGQAADGTVAVSVWGTAEGDQVAVAAIGWARCTYWYVCVAYGINEATCGTTPDPDNSVCVAVGGFWTGQGTTCADADVDAIYACVDVLIL